jgi:hypothetical protein
MFPAWFVHLGETWLGNNVSWFVHLPRGRERELFPYNISKTFVFQVGSETIFPGKRS